MKYIQLFLFTLLVIACNDDATPRYNCPSDIDCNTEDCLYTIDNASGTTLFLSCYDRWGIKSPNQAPGGGEVWLIVQNLESSFEQEGLDIKFCGYVRENTFPLQFPDPNVGELYVVDLISIGLD